MFKIFKRKSLVTFAWCGMYTGQNALLAPEESAMSAMKLALVNQVGSSKAIVRYLQVMGSVMYFVSHGRNLRLRNRIPVVVLNDGHNQRISRKLQRAW